MVSVGDFYLVLGRDLFLSTRSSESEGPVSKSVLLIVNKELPAQPGGVVEGEDDRDRGWHQQYVVGNWV